MQLFRLKYYKLLAFFIHLKSVHKYKTLCNKTLRTLQNITPTPITLIKPITPIPTTPFRTKKKTRPHRERALLYNIYRYILSEECQQDTSGNGRTDHT